MNKREEIWISLKCPTCDNMGTAIFSEIENPVYSGGLDSRFEEMRGDFSHTPEKQYQCGKCEAVFNA